MQLTDLRLQRPVLGRRHHLLAGCRSGQRSLAHQPTPGENLAAADTVLAGNK